MCDLDRSYIFEKTVEIINHVRFLIFKHIICNTYHTSEPPEVWELERFQTASDLQYHSRSLVLLPFDRERTHFCWFSIATTGMSLSCTVPRSYCYFTKFKEVILALLCINQYMAFEVPSFNDSKDMTYTKI